MEAMTKTQTFWADTNGRIVCENHGGNYLQSAIASKPKAKKHSTPITIWEKLSEDEVQEVRSWNAEVCETCHCNSK